MAPDIPAACHLFPVEDCPLFCWSAVRRVADWSEDHLSIEKTTTKSINKLLQYRIYLTMWRLLESFQNLSMKDLLRLLCKETRRTEMRKMWKFTHIT